MPPATAPPQPEQPKAKPAPPERGGLAEWVILTLQLVFAMGLLLQSFVIPTVSMEDTLLRGDHLLVDKLAYAPAGRVGGYLLPYREVQRGDIIVFRLPVDISQTYVKRVIGVPGDRIRIVNKQLYLNGKAVTEPYKVHKTAYLDSYRDNFPSAPNVRLAEPAYAMLQQNVVDGQVVVPKGFYFAMGDNRDNSLDSRYWGFVPRANIIGKPLIIYWSYDAPTERLAGQKVVDFEHLFDIATNFFSKTRWQRTLRLIRGYKLQ